MLPQDLLRVHLRQDLYTPPMRRDSTDKSRMAVPSEDKVHCKDKERGERGRAHEGDENTGLRSSCANNGQQAEGAITPDGLRRIRTTFIPGDTTYVPMMTSTKTSDPPTGRQTDGQHLYLRVGAQARHPRQVLDALVSQEHAHLARPLRAGLAQHRAGNGLP